MRFRRGLRASPGPRLASVVRRLAFWPAPRRRPNSVAADARHCAAYVSFELGRVTAVCLVASAGVATGDVSDRFVHSETFLLEHPCSVVSRRSARNPREVLAELSRALSHTEPCGSCSFREQSTFASFPPVRGRGELHRETRGRPTRTRPGKIALHGAIPTSAYCPRVTRWRFLPPRAREHVPLAPLSPPSDS
jgi:hypothetical protein